MIHQLLVSAAGEVIGRLVWGGVGELVRSGSARRADPLPDLPPGGERHHDQEGRLYGARIIGPRYPGTF